MPQTYTPNTGLTPQGQAVNNQQQLTSFALSQPSTAQVGPMVNDASMQLAEMQTPEQRQAYVNSSDVPAMNANYDELARQLYEYDKMHLQPKYSQAPAQPSDRLSFGRVGASDIMQLTPEMASSSTLYADNPKYAVTSQVTQQNSVLDALGALSQSIAKEFTATRGKYASTVSSQEALLKGLLGLLDQAAQREEREKDRAEARAERAASRASKTDSEYYGAIADGIAQLQKGEDWGTVWNRIKARFPSVAAEKIDTDLGTTWRDPGAYENWLRKGLATKEEFQQSGNSNFQKELSEMGPKLDTLASDWGKASLFDKVNPGSPTGIKLNNQRDILGQTIARLIENGRLSNQDREFYLSKLPQWWMNESQAKAAVEGFKEAVKQNLKDPNDKAVIGGGGANDPLGIL